jgi:glycosyltransferase involved in cell wall biosynthesis
VISSLKASIAILTYNQEDFVKESFESALNQDCEPINILISDDCSTDRTYEILKSTAKGYTGPHRVFLNRNDKNLGIANHMNKVLSMAKGEVIIMGAGDDISEIDRVSQVVDVYERSIRKDVLLHSKIKNIDFEGNDLGNVSIENPSDMSLKKIALSSSIYIGSSGILTRKLIESFPPIEYKGAYEDLVWGFRAKLMGGLLYIDKPLVRYRSGGVSTQANRKFGCFRDRKKSLWIQVEVLSQRYKDAFHVDKNHESLLYIKKRLMLESTRLDILNGNYKKIIKVMSRHPFLFMHALQKEVQELKKDFKASYLK